MYVAASLELVGLSVLRVVTRHDRVLIVGAIEDAARYIRVLACWTERGRLPPVVQVRVRGFA